MTQSEVKALKEVISHCEMTNCSFRRLFTAVPAMPLTESDVTDFIRERTRLWRQTWILPELRKLVAKYEKKPKGRP